MNSDFFKMAAQPSMTSTPKKGKYSSFLQDIAHLPYRLFGRWSRENSDTLNMSPPKNKTQNPSDMNPCRQSLRLLSNGYYICDEDTVCWDDLGNVSFSPTQCTVSYKENTVRIFRKRRRTQVQRHLDLKDDIEDPHCEDINYVEPPVVEQINHSSNECYPYLEDRGDHQLSGGGGSFVNNDTNTSQFSDNSSWQPTERQLVKERSYILAITLTPSIGSISRDVDDTRWKRRMRNIAIALSFIYILLLCLIFWWIRSPGHNNILLSGSGQEAEPLISTDVPIIQ